MNVASFSFLLCIHLFLFEGRNSEGTHVTETSETRRILGGKEAIPSNVKWIIRTRFDTGKGAGTCTGTVINAFWILTAAHCIHFEYNWCDTIEIFPSGWRLGDPGKKSAEKCYWYPTHDVENFQFHDIGLIKTKQNLTSSPDLYSIMRLPPPGTRNCAGQGVTFYGFGVTEEGRDRGYEPSLLVANATIIKWKQCEEEFKNRSIKDYGPSNRTSWIPKTAFCTRGDPSQNLGAVCVGDSGGPILKDGILVGVISASLQSKVKGCSQVSLYTSIEDHLRWIWSLVDPGKDTTFMKGMKQPT